MTARALLEQLHTRNMALESYGLTFRVNAQTEAIKDELRPRFANTSGTSSGFSSAHGKGWKWLTGAASSQNEPGSPATSLRTTPHRRVSRGREGAPLQ